jgi:hypothetical protein
MSTQQRDWLSKWLPLVIAIGGNLVTVAYGYGQLVQRIAPLEKHTAESFSLYVTRQEFNQRTLTRDAELTDLKARLDRMEQKLDRLLERK